MAHNVKPSQKVRILTVQIAVPADMGEAECADGVSGLLTENGICAKDPWVLDWRYVRDFNDAPEVQVGYDPEEGEAFGFCGSREATLG